MHPLLVGATRLPAMLISTAAGLAHSEALLVTLCSHSRAQRQLNVAICAADTASEYEGYTGVI